MTTTEIPVDNGVNVEALLGVRDALAGTPQIAQFQWRSMVSWVNGTHSRSDVETFYGFGDEQRHHTTFSYDTDHPLQFAAQDNGVTPVEYVLVALGGCLTAGVAAVAQQRSIQLRSVRATLAAEMDLLLGKRMLVTGATGGVGRIAVQLGHASGALVTALVRDIATSAGRLRRLGAAAVTEQPGGDFDFILDAVGGTIFGLVIGHLAPRGVLVNIGTQDDEETVTFQARRFDRAFGAKIYTLNLPSELASHDSAAGDLARLCALAAAGRLDGQVEFEGSWRQPGPAIDALLRRRIGGKAVLHVDLSAKAAVPDIPAVHESYAVVLPGALK